jgi:hypothetical protein
MCFALCSLVLLNNIFLEHPLPELLDIQRNMHDSAAARFSHAARNYLETADTGWWVGMLNAAQIIHQT